MANKVWKPKALLSSSQISIGASTQKPYLSSSKAPQTTKEKSILGAYICPSLDSRVREVNLRCIHSPLWILLCSNSKVKDGQRSI